MRPGVELDELNITPAQVAAVVALVDEGKLSNKLARQVVEGVLAGEGEPEQVMTARGLALVRDDSVTRPRSTRRWPPIPMWRRRFAAARSPRRARSSAP